MGQTSKFIGIIQARMGSMRLPGKVLAQIAGNPMLWHVVNRVRMARSLDQVVVATSNEVSDHPIADFCARKHIDVYRGSEEDVLDRYCQAARKFAHGTIVRITGDCPLVDSAVIDKVVGAHEDGSYDYMTNIFPRTYPDGLDVEVFSLGALERAWLEAANPYDREHVTPYMREHPKLFRIGNVLHPVNLSNLRWTVDHPEDLQFVRAVYDHMKVADFGLGEVLGLLKEHPELMKINSGIEQAQSIR